MLLMTVVPARLRVAVALLAPALALACGRSQPYSGHAACVEHGSWIYTLDTDTTLSRFDPVQLTFDDLPNKVVCRDLSGIEDQSGPNSMAVDMNGVAWAGYQSGALYRIDTTNASCQPTSFVANQHGMRVFGMEFLFDPATSAERLYVAGGPSIRVAASTLATIDMSSFVLTPVGTVSVGFVEPAATPDGAFWGFAPSHSSASGTPTLARIDPTNGNVLESTGYPGISTDGAFAMKFFQGGFFIFDSPSIYRVDLATGTLTTLIDGVKNPELMQLSDGNGTRRILGAGFSMCPPTS